MSKDTGGPAFPVVTRGSSEDSDNQFGHQFSSSTWQFAGMTLRDYFAAKAPFPYPNEWKRYYCNQRGYRGEAQCMADWSYDWADAMLRARGVA